VRKILSARRREHVPEGPPSLIVHRKGGEWGVVMLHGGREIHWWPVAEARRHAANMISLANLAARPGELPGEELG
jgi:hypothetical protein